MGTNTALRVTEVPQSLFLPAGDSGTTVVRE